MESRRSHGEREDGRVRLAARCTARLCTVAAWVALVPPSPGQAQGILSQGPPAQPPAASQDSAAAAPRAIPTSEIPLQAEAALARLQAIEKQLSFDPDLALIEEELPEELGAISRSHERLGRIVLEQLSARELTILESFWQSHEHRLQDWVGTFDEELRALQEASESTRRIRERWRLTLEALEEEDVVADLVAEQTRAVLDFASGLRQAQREQLEYVLRIKSELDDGLDGVRHVLSEFEGARASVRGRTLSRNEPPIWGLASIREQSLSQEAVRLWGEDWSALTEFLTDQTDRALFNVLFFLLIAFLAIRLRDRIDLEVTPGDESLAGAAETLHKPISAALVLSLFIANALYPRAPILVLQILAIAAIVPLYRLLPHSRDALVNRAMRALLILFGVAGLGELVVPPSFEYRILNLGLALALVAVAGWLLRVARQEEPRSAFWSVVVWRGVQVVFVAGMIAALANILGFTLLSDRLVSGVLYAAYFGLTLVIGYRVVAGVLRLLPGTKLGKASHIMRTHGDLVTSRAILVLRVFATILWALFALEAFDILAAVGAWGSDTFTGTLRIAEFEFSLEKLFAFVVAVVLALWIARFVRFVLEVEVLPRVTLKRGIGNAVATVTQWVILGIGLIVAASAAGLEAAQLAIVFGALSVGIGFGLQNIVNNFVSGLILIFEQPVKVGDKIEVSSLGLVGEVRKIGIRSSVVRTFDGAEVIVPNANLISSEVINWTLSDLRRRFSVEVGVAYGTDPHRVIEVLLGVAAAHPEILRYPEPQVLFLGFGDSSLNFRLMAWTATFEDFFRLRSELTVGTNDALKEANITIPFPQRDLHLKTVPAAFSVPDPAAGSPDSETGGMHVRGEETGPAQTP